ncbi:hypothetical protein A0O28_0036510 [Trichoderma guizhouense]|uniref:Uncharacterized protein n=1 Tax=Trichoderma guizhouense TaxID=1491466 RepID=A0A1T3CN97_9HYPO|nr:hypothetical protein A0O28_0036510 [Trichoderma guizhouense]
MPPSNTTGLHAAAVLGLTEATKLLLERGHNLNAIDSNGFTPLSWASIYGHEAVAELLIFGGANLEVKDSKYDCSPLMRAATNGHEAIVRLLLEKGVDINTQNRYGRTALSFAAQYKHKTIIELLRQRGATIDAKDARAKLQLVHYQGPDALPRSFSENENQDISQNSKESRYIPPEIGSDVDLYQWIKSDADLNAKDDDGRTLLLHAAQLGRQNSIQLLIETGKVDLHEPDSETGRTPLHWAAACGHLPVVELLANAGAQLDMKDKEFQMTALVSSIIYHRNDIFDFLLQRNADVHVLDMAGRTTLYYAAASGELTMIQQLVDRGVDINTRDSYGRTALFPAVEIGNFDAVMLLIEEGADVNAEGKHGGTPLHCSIFGAIDITRLLIERGADVNAPFDGDWTLLFIAVVYGKIDVVRLLVQTGADINFRWNGGITPLAMCILHGYSDIVPLLIDLGADVNAQDDKGRSPLYHAIDKENIPAVEILVGMDDVDINRPDAEGNTPFILAKEGEKHRIIRILFQSDDLQQQHTQCILEG